MDVQLSNSLGIDLGTSSVKVGVFDERLRMIGGGKEEYQVEYVGKNGAEQSAVKWWNSIVKVCREIEERSPSEWKKIKFVGVTAQFSGTTAIDRNGIPLRNPIIWLDSRGEEATRELITGFPSIAGYNIGRLIRWIRLTGGAPTKSGKDSLSHILYLKANEPNVYSETYKFLEPKDYINLKITGKIASTYDTMILHWVTDNRDINNVRYDRKLLSVAGLDISKLPNLIGSWDAVGNIAKEAASELGLSEEVVVSGGAGDIQSSLIGSGCIDNFEPLIYIGSSSWISAHVPFKKTDIFHNMASLPSGLPGKYFIPAEQENAGSALDYLRKTISNEAKIFDFDELNLLAGEAPPGSDGLMFFPWLFGERAPVESRSLRGSLFNLSITHQKSHLARSVMEGVAMNLRWLSTTFGKFIGLKPAKYVMAGGGSLSDIWSQILADVLQVEIASSGSPVFVNAKGAAILGLLAGGLDMKSISGNVKSIRKTFLPSKSNAKVYDGTYGMFVEFYRRNHRLMERFNDERKSG